MKPLWLLDVDGVLNAIDPKPKHEAAWEGGYQRHGVKASNSTYSISYAPKLMAGIVELIELDLVEIQWLTTWRHLANNGLRMLFGFPEFEVASTDAEYNNPTGRWWKLSTARRLAVDRPLIWTDDDLQDDEAARWVTERPWPTLAICPSYRGGLQPAEFTKIQDFCIDHAEIEEPA